MESDAVATLLMWKIGEPRVFQKPFTGRYVDFSPKRVSSMGWVVTSGLDPTWCKILVSGNGLLDGLNLDLMEAQPVW